MPASTTGHATMTAFAVIGNHRPINSAHKAHQMVDAQLYIGNPSFTDAICGFRYYAGPGCHPIENSEPAVYEITVNFARADATIEPLATPDEGYHLIGDIKSATPISLAQIPDDDAPLPPSIDFSAPPSEFDIRRPPRIVLVGMATQCSRDLGTFRIDIEQWLSCLKSNGEQATAVKIEGSKRKILPRSSADAFFLCKFPEQGRFKDKRPMPYDRRYLMVQGTVTNIKLKSSTSNQENQTVDYIEVSIEDVCFTGNSAVGGSGSIPNSLDSLTPPTKSKGRFIAYGKLKNTTIASTSSTQSLPSTSSTSTLPSTSTVSTSTQSRRSPSELPEAGPSNHKRARVSSLSDKENVGSVIVNKSLMPTSKAGTPQERRAADPSDDDDIYA